MDMYIQPGKSVSCEDESVDIDAGFLENPVFFSSCVCLYNDMTVIHELMFCL